MDFFTLIGLIVIIYLFVYLVTLSISDCDLSLFWAEKVNNNLHTLKDKVIWITGASSGIGEYLAIELCKHGAKVILTARSEPNLERVKQRCVVDGGALPDNVSIVPLDVTEFSKHKSTFQKVIQLYGKLDILVNNAGRSQRATWENISLEVDRQAFDLNVFSVISLSRLALNYFNDRGSGHLVVTSSLAGILPVPFSSSYTGSKHAIHGYFNSLRNEKMGANLDITLLCPGPVFSNFLHEAFTGEPDQKFGQSVSESDKRMTTERCAYLSAVAIANKLDEVWMALFPLLPLSYILTTYPYLTRRILKFFGPHLFQKMRDSRVTVETN